MAFTMMQRSETHFSRSLMMQHGLRRHYDTRHMHTGNSYMLRERCDVPHSRHSRTATHGAQLHLLSARRKDTWKCRAARL